MRSSARQGRGRYNARSRLRRGVAEEFLGGVLILAQAMQVKKGGGIIWSRAQQANPAAERRDEAARRCHGGTHMQVIERPLRAQTADKREALT